MVEGFFDWDKLSRRPVVKRPYNCMVGCTTCANICPVEAILFPDVDILKPFIRKASVVRKAREKLREHGLI